MAARALDLQPGDEVLATEPRVRRVRSHVAVAVRADRRALRPRGRRRALRARGPSERARCSSRTSPPRPRCSCRSRRSSRRARAEELVTIVDGAHAVAQVDLDLSALGADFYAGNCHKWLCAPKGAGFLYVRPEWQERVDGPIVSWGYDEPATFLSRTEHQGTRDPAAYLAVPDAIAFQREHDVRERCVALARDARSELCALLGTEPIAPDAQILQMASVRLPEPQPDLSQRLFDEHRIEIPTMGRADDDLLRISIAPYTEREDVERLLDALPAALRTSRSPA